MPSRRRFVAALGGVSIAGCLGRAGDAGSGDGTAGTGSQSGGGLDASIDGWRQQGADATRRRYVPDEGGPQGSVGVQWSARITPEDAGAVEGAVHSALVADGRFVAATGGGQLVALSAADGTELWTHGLADGASRSVANRPAVSGDTLLYNDAGVHAHSVVDGSVRWSLEAPVAYHPPLVRDGTAFVVSSEDSRVYALSVADGSQRWRSEPLEPGSTRLAAVDGTLVVAQSGTLSTLDIATGERLWTEDRSSRSGTYRIAVAGDTIFRSVDIGVLSAVDLATGETRWTVETQRVDGQFAVGADHVFVRFDDLVARDRATGEERWRVGHDRWGVGLHPTVADGSAYVSVTPSTLNALSAEDGSQQWQVSLEDASLAGCLLVDGTLYVASAGGRLFAVGEV